MSTMFESAQSKSVEKKKTENEQLETSSCSLLICLVIWIYQNGKIIYKL